MATQLVENLLNGAGKLFEHGIRLPAAAASCAHARVLSVEQGASGRKCSCQEIDMFWCPQIKRAPTVTDVKGLNIGYHSSPHRTHLQRLVPRRQLVRLDNDRDTLK